jgi:hypothetical protein
MRRLTAATPAGAHQSQENDMAPQTTQTRRLDRRSGRLRKRVVGRFSRGIEQLPDTPDKRAVGRFSRGIEQLPDTPDKRVVGRFSRGIEQLPDTPEKRAVGSFSQGIEHSNQEVR